MPSRIRHLLSWTPALLLIAACSVQDEFPGDQAASPTAEHAWRALSASSDMDASITWDPELGVARELIGSFPTAPGTPEQAASAFLAQHAPLFGLPAGQLEVSSVRTSLLGSHVRFRQRTAGLLVLDAEIAVHLQARSGVARVGLVRSSLVPNLAVRPASLTRHAAVTRAGEWAANAGMPQGRVEDAEEVVLQNGSRGWLVDVRNEQPARLVRLVLEDDGRVTDARELLRHADGTGWVFDPNPVAVPGGFAFADGNNADSPELTSARVQVVLPGLDGTGRLSGPYVDAYNGVNSRSTEPGLVFDYTRSNDFFEEVMAYYHLDGAQRRLQALGFTDVMSWQLKAQVNGSQQDNSWYDSKKKTITYGAGGVDDAEDADVILHEYGHAILDDQVPGFGGGAQSGAIGEGFSDFHAVAPHAANANMHVDSGCVAPWDATAYSPPPCLRRTDTDKHHPEAGNNDVHADGEMWSSALWEGAQTVGALEMLRLVVESNFLLNPNATFQQASDSVLLVDQQLAGGANAETLRRLLTWRGLNRKLTAPSSYAGPWEAHPVSVTSASPYADSTDEWVDVTHPGAAAIRLHFSSFATEVNYDHVYLYDADVHLYAIRTGNLGAFDSVVVPGDTVRVRLVSDSNTGGSGYAIDRYDVPDPNGADGGLADAQADGGQHPDSSDPADSAAPDDSSTSEDGDSPGDAGSSGDGAVEPDATSQSDSSPPLESGPGLDASGAADSAVSAAPAANGSDDDGGCGCRTAPTSTPRGVIAGLLLGLAAIARRGRRRPGNSRVSSRSN